jgi:hypothetical protein
MIGAPHRTKTNKFFNLRLKTISILIKGLSQANKILASFVAAQSKSTGRRMKTKLFLSTKKLFAQKMERKGSTVNRKIDVKSRARQESSCFVLNFIYDA